MTHPTVHALANPDKPAVIMAGSGETVTYRELDERSNQCAHLFRSLGLQHGDTVAFCLENRAEFFDLVWGAQRAGLIYVAISCRLTPSEMDYILNERGNINYFLRWIYPLIALTSIKFEIIFSFTVFSTITDIAISSSFICV